MNKTDRLEIRLSPQMKMQAIRTAHNYQCGLSQLVRASLRLALLSVHRKDEEKMTNDNDARPT